MLVRPTVFSSSILIILRSSFRRFFLFISLLTTYYVLRPWTSPANGARSTRINAHKIALRILTYIFILFALTRFCGVLHVSYTHVLHRICSMVMAVSWPLLSTYLFLSAAHRSPSNMFNLLNYKFFSLLSMHYNSSIRLHNIIHAVAGALKHIYFDCRYGVDMYLSTIQSVRFVRCVCMFATCATMNIL